MLLRIPFVSRDANKYDVFLYLLVATIGLGGYGGSLQIVRLFAIIMAPLLIHILIQKKDSSSISFLIFFGFWYAYNVVSLFWTPDLKQAYKELVYYPIHMLIFLEIVAFSRYANRSIKTISSAWVFAFLCTSVVAIWEIVTDNHLVMSVQESGATMNNGLGEILVRKFASVTFGNYNAYCTYISFSVPFIVFQLYNTTSNKIWKLLCLVAIFLSFYIILMNGSRGGIISLTIVTTFYILYTIQAGRRGQRFVVYLILCLAYAALYYYSDVLFETLNYRLAVVGMTETGSRSEIWEDAFALFSKTTGIGTGIGSMAAAMSKVRLSGEVVATHNLFVEFALQYGVIIFLLFICFLAFLLKRSFRANEVGRRMMLKGALFSLPFASVINSGYLLEPMTWAYFASLFVFATTSVETEDDMLS